MDVPGSVTGAGGMRVSILVAASSVLLAGCATVRGDHYYPRLITPMTAADGKTCIYSTETGPANEQLRALLNDAARLQCAYSNGYVATAQAQDVSQLPIVMLAAAAGILGINGGPAASQQIGKLGVVGLSYSSARGLAMPKELPKAYLAGYHAISCVLARGPRFVGEVAKARAGDLNNQIGKNEKELDWLTKLLGAEPEGTPSPEQRKALDSARTLARQALATARTIRGPAIADSYAFDSPFPIFLEALSEISVAVATAGRSRTEADYKTLLNSFPTVPNAAAIATSRSVDEQPKVAEKEVGALTTQIIAQAETVLTSSSNLAASRPGLVEALDLVKACPKGLAA